MLNSHSCTRTHARTHTRTHAHTCVPPAAVQALAISPGPSSRPLNSIRCSRKGVVVCAGQLAQNHGTRTAPLLCTKRAHRGGLATLVQRNGEMVRSARLHRSPFSANQRGLRTVTVPQKAKNSRSDASSADGGTLSTCGKMRSRASAHERGSQERGATGASRDGYLHGAHPLMIYDS